VHRRQVPGGADLDPHVLIVGEQGAPERDDLPDQVGEVEVHELVDDLAGLQHLVVEEVGDEPAELPGGLEDELEPVRPAVLLRAAQGEFREPLDPLEGRADHVQRVHDELLLSPEEPSQLVEGPLLRAHGRREV